MVDSLRTVSGLSVGGGGAGSQANPRGARSSAVEGAVVAEGSSIGLGTQQADDGAKFHRVVAGILFADVVLASIPQLGVERYLGGAE